MLLSDEQGSDSASDSLAVANNSGGVDAGSGGRNPGPELNNPGRRARRWWQVLVLGSLVLLTGVLIFFLRNVVLRQDWWVHHSLEPRAAAGGDQHPASTSVIPAVALASERSE